MDTKAKKRKKASPLADNNKSPDSSLPILEAAPVGEAELNRIKISMGRLFRNKEITREEKLQFITDLTKYLEYKRKHLEARTELPF
jgi:hypothetical protein